MQLSDFDYELPEELIAQFPLTSRSASRLLELDSTQEGKYLLRDRLFTDIKSLLLPGDLLIFNDTKVIPARVYGTKASGGKVELLIERTLSDSRVLSQVRASKAPLEGSTLFLGDPLKPFQIKVIQRQTIQTKGQEEITPFYVLEFPGDCLEILNLIGELPLPPYITHSANSEDATRYQTVIAKNPGAVAAPTAGLHFDLPLLEQLKENGVEIAYITLHVGAGTFTPVRTEDLSKHQMHFERYTISPKTRNALDQALASKRRVIAVGTTSLRALESSVLMGDNGDTNLFITPGYQFAVVDALITNFHLPKSTLLMLVSAFAGYEPIRAAYQHAIQHQYRFFSYGDAMFLRRK